MRRAGGILAVAVATLLVCCSADPHQDSEVNEHGGDRYDSDQKPRSPAPGPAGKSLVRGERDTANMLLPYLLARQHYYGSGGDKRDLFPMSAIKYGYGDYPKRNFDEIDLSGLNKFVDKRNIDEIDQTSMPFPYATKRFYHLYGPNHSPLSSFDKKRYRADYPMDEIDLSHFPIGSKRSQDGMWSLR